MENNKSNEIIQYGGYLITIAFLLFLYADIYIYKYPNLIVNMRIGIIILFIIYTFCKKTKYKNFAPRIYYISTIIVLGFINILILLNTLSSSEYLSRSIQVTMIIYLGIIMFSEENRQSLNTMVLANTILILIIQLFIIKDFIHVFFTFFNLIVFSLGLYIFNNQYINSKLHTKKLTTKLNLQVEKLEAEVAIQEMMKMELTRKATHDGMTGFLNRSEGMKILHEYFIESLKNEIPLSVCFLDLNDLKIVNDTLGHDSGDQYILDFTNIIKQSIRNDDTCVRLGGDEFLIILLNVSLENANNILYKMNHNIDLFNKSFKRHYNLSVSYGICERIHSGTIDVKSLVACADNKMFEYKRNLKISRSIQ